jgi:hypothetical protein
VLGDLTELAAFLGRHDSDWSTPHKATAKPRKQALNAARQSKTSIYHNVRRTRTVLTIFAFGSAEKNNLRLAAYGSRLAEALVNFFSHAVNHTRTVKFSSQTWCDVSPFNQRAGEDEELQQRISSRSGNIRPARVTVDRGVTIRSRSEFLGPDFLFEKRPIGPVIP